jgi:hypothetical protein
MGIRAIIAGKGWVIARSVSTGEYSEHIIGSLLDPQKGRFDFIAFGAASPKSTRGKDLQLGNEIFYQLQDTGNPRFSLFDTRLVTDNYAIKKNPERIRSLLFLCDLWTSLLHDQKPYPETKTIFDLFSSRPHFKHLILVHTIHLFHSENIFPNWQALSPEEQREFFNSIGLPHWKPGQGTQKFFSDALSQPLEFFLDKLPSSSVMQETFKLLNALFIHATGSQLLSF